MPNLISFIERETASVSRIRGKFSPQKKFSGLPESEMAGIWSSLGWYKGFFGSFIGIMIWKCKA
jgi:hypothetical protein